MWKISTALLLVSNLTLLSYQFLLKPDEEQHWQAAYQINTTQDIPYSAVIDLKFTTDHYWLNLAMIEYPNSQEKHYYGWDVNGKLRMKNKHQYRLFIDDIDVLKNETTQFTNKQLLPNKSEMQNRMYSVEVVYETKEYIVIKYLMDDIYLMTLNKI